MASHPVSPADGAIDTGNLAQRPGLALIAGPRLQLLALALPAVISLVVWRLSLLHVDVSNLDSYGLPPALPVAWYCALLLSIAGAVTAITVQRTSGLIMVAYVVVVAIILFGTVPVLSEQPHYGWVYKHIGVVRYLEANGAVNPDIDIYNRWPGFFALAAAFSSVAGRTNPVTYAGWAELFFLLFDAVLAMAAIKAVTRNTRIAAGAALIFVVTNWVGQTYYSPQALAFALSLAIIVIILRQLRISGTGISDRLTRLMERVGRVSQLPTELGNTAQWPRWAAITAVLVLDAVIVASHQLTPYMLLVSIAILMLAGVARPWWMLFGMAVITFAYLGANFDFVQHNYGLFTSIDPFNNAHGLSITSRTPAAGKLFNKDVQLLLTGAVWLGGLCAMFRLLRRGLLVRALPFVLLALCPVAILFGQNYGGEASLRIILFSSPWLAALISWALATIDRRRLRWALTMAVTVVFTALFVPSFLGQEELNIISPAEVRSSEHFYDHARPGSVLLLSAPGFPYRYGATYPEFGGPEGDANPNLMTEPYFQNQQLGAAAIPRVINKIQDYARHGYILFSEKGFTYARIFRMALPGSLVHLEAAIAKSPNFRLWYRNKSARIYELVQRHGS